jgi:hypothetical protein
MRYRRVWSCKLMRVGNSGYILLRS